MSVKAIASKDNPAFREWLALAEDRQARRTHGQTLLDGEHLLYEALQSGLRAQHLILSESGGDAMTWQSRFPAVPITVLAPALFKRLSPVATPTGVLAVIDIPRPDPQAASRFALLLENIQDPGNLGALLRTAAAAGVDTVFLSAGCAEAWSPKALRGSQGGHFRLAVHESVDLVTTADSFMGSVYAAALRQNKDLFQLDLTPPLAFAFGNEGAGLSEELLAHATPFSIPMASAIESLNVAAAAAICMFERVRQTRMPA